MSVGPEGRDIRYPLADFYELMRPVCGTIVFVDGDLLHTRPRSPREPRGVDMRSLDNAYRFLLTRIVDPGDRALWLSSIWHDDLMSYLIIVEDAALTRLRPALYPDAAPFGRMEELDAEGLGLAYDVAYAAALVSVPLIAYERELFAHVGEKAYWAMKKRAMPGIREAFAVEPPLLAHTVRAHEMRAQDFATFDTPEDVKRRLGLSEL